MFAACLYLTFYLSALAAAGDSSGDPLPDDQVVGWQAGNHHRGTWDIVSSCLSTIIACTWSIQHPNVPGREDGQFSRWLRSFKWMIITILFPELIVIHAIFEFIMAFQALRKMEKGKCVELPWWLPNSTSSPLRRSLLNRFSCLLCSSKEREPADAENQPVKDHSNWTLTHCFFANMGGFRYDEGGSQFPITGLQLAENPDRLEWQTITKEDIQDKSKRDWFAKGVATLQFLQLALSLIVRTNQGLAFSQLETVTLGFAVCGAVIYLVYLYKPQKVDTAISLKPRSESPQKRSSQSDSGERASPRPLLFKKTYDSLWDILINEGSHRGTADAKSGEQSLEQIPRIPNDNIPISESSVAHPGVLLLALASGLFGAMHAIAWNFEFPSIVEKILWQAATVIAAGSPVVGLVTIPLAQLTIPAGDPQPFMQKCLRLMRESSWNVSEKDAVDKAYRQLEKHLLNTEPRERRPYISVFSPEQNPPQAVDLAQKLLNFLKITDPSIYRGKPPEDLHKDKIFIQQFQILIDLMGGKESKKLNDTAKTNVFPQKNLLPKAFNRGIVYLTSILYCVSRLSLLAVAFSSLRQMPESVYVNTPWTKYIPTLGSSG